MNACDSKLKSCLLSIMEEEEVRLKEELKHTEPHVFSAEYRETMDKAMQVHKRKEKRDSIRRFAVAATIVALLTGYIIFIGSENLHASNFAIDILEWLEDFFVVEDGVNGRQKSDVLFEESQIGYLPEGFEKTGEAVKFSEVLYVYQNTDGDRMQIAVYRSGYELIVDNDEIKQEVHINAAGYEYKYVADFDKGNDKVIWKDDKGFIYYIMGNVEEAELIKVMDNITYYE